MILVPIRNFLFRAVHVACWRLGNWLLKVAGCPVREGHFVVWESQGMLQWDSPRQVTRVATYGRRWYAWTDGSKTAIPADELRIVG